MCFEQLGFIFSFIMNKSLSPHSLQSVWKQSEIIPVPKKKKMLLRPIALTSVVIQCMEKNNFKKTESSL